MKVKNYERFHKMKLYFEKDADDTVINIISSSKVDQIDNVKQ